MNQVSPKETPEKFNLLQLDGRTCLGVLQMAHILSSQLSVLGVEYSSILGCISVFLEEQFQAIRRTVLSLKYCDLFT